MPAANPQTDTASQIKAHLMSASGTLSAPVEKPRRWVPSFGQRTQGRLRRLRSMLLGALMVIGVAAKTTPAGASPNAPMSIAPPSAAIADPALVLLLRHATAPGVGDPGVFQLRNCTTQRNLDDVGKAQSRKIGLTLVSLGFIPKQIWSSQWCRTMETAQIIANTLSTPTSALAGSNGSSLEPSTENRSDATHPLEVIELSLLNSTFRDRGDARAQNEALRQFITALDPTAGPYLMISHQVNITDLVNIFPASGHGVWLKLTGDTLKPWVLYPADTDRLTLPSLEKP